MISNLLDNNFIHCDIHGRSCQKIFIFLTPITKYSCFLSHYITHTTISIFLIYYPVYIWYPILKYIPIIMMILITQNSYSSFPYPQYPYHNTHTPNIVYSRYHCWWGSKKHYSDVMMEGMTSEITSLTIVYSTAYWGTDQRKHQSFVEGINRLPVNSLHKCPVMQKMFPFDDIIIMMGAWSIGSLSWAKLIFPTPACFWW